jgi:hypothetical protein
VVRVDSGPRRGIALLAVVVLHVGLVAVVVLALHERNSTRTPEAVTLTFLDLPSQTLQAPAVPGKPPFSPARSTAITLPPMTQDQTPGQVDWHAEAHEAVQPSGVRPARPLDANPATGAMSAPGAPDIAVHHAGEQYRDADGTAIVFVSDHCFVASPPPPLGTPDVIARAAPTRTVCRGDPGWSRADLFRDLPAYGRYHQLPAPKP